MDISRINETKRRQKGGQGTSLTKFLHQDIKLFTKKFSAREKESFYAELALLLGMGVDIRTAFEIILQNTEKDEHRQLLAEIVTGIEDGQRVHEPFEKRKAIFSNYEIKSLRIGDETGRLPEILNELSVYFGSVVRLKRQIVGLMTYPLIVISLAIVIVYFMLAFVVPVFTDIILQTGGQLPGITKFLIAASEQSNLFFLLAFSTVIILFTVHRVYSKNEVYRHFTSAAVRKIPVVGTLVQRIYLARFCQSMKLLSSAHVRLHESLGLVKEMIGYYPMERALNEVQQDVVEKGQSLHVSLSKHSIFPKNLIALVRISEEVNAPAKIYERLFMQYTAAVEHQQGILSKLIEPVFIVILGLFVGFILVAMYLPMFELSSGGHF